VNHPVPAGTIAWAVDLNRFTFVDALRGVAAFSVVLYHGVGHVPDLPVGILAHGDLGVAVFFVLSGFVIAHSLRDQTMTLGGMGRFMLRRSIRLDPPYWVAIAIAVLATRAKGGDVDGAQVAAHFIYAQDLLGLGDLNPVFWTLCLEVQFYLIFSLLLLLPGRPFVAAFVVSLIWPLGLASNAPSGLFVHLWYGFLLGVLSYWTWRDIKLLPMFAAYAGVIAVAGIVRSDLFGLTCVVTASLLIAAQSSISTLFNWRWLQFLGTISYSLYLIHNPVIGVVFRIGEVVTSKSAVSEAVIWVVSIVACIVVATVLWIAIERPSAKLSKSISQKGLGRAAVAH
jgi:peptidoglycan/LPS O-acetylase OafA/YrhL